MKESYFEMCKRHQQEYDQFIEKYGFAAFDQRQFDQGMKSLQLDPANDVKKIRNVAGMFVLRERVPELLAIFKQQREELATAMQSYDFAYSAFREELANHEFVVTQDSEDTLAALNLTVDDVVNTDHLRKAYEDARRDYMKQYPDYM